MTSVPWGAAWQRTSRRWQVCRPSVSALMWRKNSLNAFGALPVTDCGADGFSVEYTLACRPVDLVPDGQD